MEKIIIFKYISKAKSVAKLTEELQFLPNVKRITLETNELEDDHTILKEYKNFNDIPKYGYEVKKLEIIIDPNNQFDVWIYYTMAHSI